MANASPRRYDVTFKDLVQARPRDVLTLAGVSDVIDVQYEDTDLSALIAVADKVLRVRSSRGEYFVHFEFQSGPDSDLLDRMFWYNAALYYRHRLPVLTVVVLLAPGADSPKLNGTLGIATPEGFASTTFNYKAVRLWKTPVEAILQGPIGILPLAPLCKGSDDVESVIATIDRRFSRELKQADEGKYWLAVCMLMGLYYDSDTVFRLLPKGKAMKESSTYQAILDEGLQKGQAKEARRMLLRAGKGWLGTPSSGIRERLETLDDVEAMEAMAERLPEVSSWDELFTAPTASPRKSRRKKS